MKVNKRMNIVFDIRRIFISTWLILIGNAQAGLPAPIPIHKNGNCPPGYNSQGDFCAPNSSARFVTTKQGSCPTGYTSHGNYCMAGPNSKLAIHKGQSNCPSGYSSHGNYCVSSK